MASSRGKQAEKRRPAARLYLVTPQDPAGLANRLAEALAAADIAAVLLRLPQGEEAVRADHAKSIAPTVQNNGAALLLDGDAEIAVRAGADGAHLGGVEALAAALPILKPAHIAGCGRLMTRPEAMRGGEGGGGYGRFGGSGA